MRFKGVETRTGEIQDLVIPSANEGEVEIEARGLLALPSLIDPHVHFRFPGEIYKEQWESAARAALASGISFVFDMPNNHPPCTTVERLEEKRRAIREKLEAAKLPLQFGLYLGASRGDLAEISHAKGKAIGVKIFMGGSTGTLLLDDPEDQSEAFARAADADLVIAVHAEDEVLLQRERLRYSDATDVSIHSLMRPREAAIKATERALALAHKYGTKLYLLHVSTKEELVLIREAKERGIRVLAEATPHHLYFTQEDYRELGSKIQVNPPVRTLEDVEALWEALSNGTIDTIGSDHAPHTREEKGRPFGQSPSGIAAIELTLPLLMHAVNRGWISIERLIALTRENIARFFDIAAPQDWVLVDRNCRCEVSDERLYTQCGFTPYAHRTLQGWPIYCVAGGRLFNLQEKLRTREHSDGHR